LSRDFDRTRAEAAPPDQEREALPVASDEKGALSIARRRQRAALLASAMGNTVTASAQGYDCGAVGIRRTAQNGPRWPHMNTLKSGAWHH